MTTYITIYGLSLIALVTSLVKSKEKTMKAFKIGQKAFLKTLPSILLVVGIVGLTLGLLTPEIIASFIGEEAGFIGTIVAAVLGAVTLIPSIVAFPLAGSLLENGASLTTMSAFVTTLVMVGFVTMPMEIKILGKKFTFLRNGLSFIFALVIAAIMGVLL